MTRALLLNDLAIWSAQVALVTAIAAVFPALAHLRAPHARLHYWQFVLVVCLAMPFVGSWEQPVVVITRLAHTAPAQVRIAAPVVTPGLPWMDLLLWVICAGITVRVIWLIAGFLRLARYRRHSIPLVPPSPWGTEAALLVSDQVGGPVTFGLRAPVVLLPANFVDFDESSRDAVLCHEILHVRRRDWLFTVAEEIVRAVLWFHPAIWWTLAEIQLAREQAVDREAIEMIKARDAYVDVLLSMAGATLGVDAAPAFLRKRHLRQRLVSILKEARMSKKRTISTLTAGLAVVAGACWFVTSALPLRGAPQTISDGPGVNVDMNGVPLMHRPAVMYPHSAISKGVEGSVSVLLRTDADGNVVDASIASGPDELRRGVLQSVLEWHLGKSAAQSTRQVTITFTLPKNDGPATIRAMSNQTVPVPRQVVRGGVLAPIPAPLSPPPPGPATVSGIHIFGLPDSAKDDLVRSLPVHVGDTLTLEDFAKVASAVRAFDEHLSFSTVNTSPSEIALNIVAPGNMAAPRPVGGIRVGANVQSANLIKQVKPAYPPLAKAARIQGTVQLDARIGKDGTVQNLTVISGPPLLIQAAIAAAQQWQYKPTLLNGEPTEVQTTISIDFTLADQ